MIENPLYKYDHSTCINTREHRGQKHSRYDGTKESYATVCCVMLLVVFCYPIVVMSWIVQVQTGPLPLSPFAISTTNKNKFTMKRLRASTMQFKCSSSSSSSNGSGGGGSSIVSATNIKQLPRVEAILSSGLDPDDISLLMEIISDECQDLGVFFDDTNIISISSPLINFKVPGALGRIILFRFDSGIEDDQQQQQNNLLEDLERGICERIDTVNEEVLLCFQTDDRLKVLKSTANDEDIYDCLSAIMEEHVQQYEMILPLQIIPNTDDTKKMFVPSIHVEIDGGYVSYHPSTMLTLNTTSNNNNNNNNNSTTTGEEEEGGGGENEEKIWDTSTLLVFDHLVHQDLRKRLLDVVLDEDSDHHDPRDGPNPDRWVRGGLIDHNVAETEEEEEEENSNTEIHDSIGWGLTDSGLEGICFDHHEALQEMESLLANLFPDFVVTRLPEVILGSSVTPITANAPTTGNEFDYHIDADPNTTPSSPWTDVYGRYPNRAKGKPRFISCLVYLNEEWDGDSWGAPTRFVDIPTDQDLNVYDVKVYPGRCVIMDQDIGHTVVAPRAAAGKRPRYSLVWKLVLHPRSIGQDMKYLASGREALWPETEYFGSAAQNLGPCEKNYR